MKLQDLQNENIRWHHIGTKLTHIGVPQRQYQCTTNVGNVCHILEILDICMLAMFGHLYQYQKNMSLFSNICPAHIERHWFKIGNLRHVTLMFGRQS